MVFSHRDELVRAKNGLQQRNVVSSFLPVVVQERIDGVEERTVGLLEAFDGLLFFHDGSMLQKSETGSLADGLLEASVVLLFFHGGLLSKTDVKMLHPVVVQHLGDVSFERNDGS